MVARVTPPLPALEDGYQILFTFEIDPDVCLWERAGKPPGVDGGEKIDTTTMHNVEWRTASPQSLKELTDCTLTVGYNPKVYDQIDALINQNGLITVKFPDDSELDFYGYLRTFEPPEHTIGEYPEAEATIVCTNVDDNGDEVGPNYRSSGTGT